MIATRIVIDGVRYVPEDDKPLQKEAEVLLCEVCNTLWGEAWYDPFNEATQSFAAPLADKMKRLNEILKFRD